MKKEIILIVLGILLFGAVNASIVEFLSNIVTGEIKIRGPVFYLDNTDIMGDGEGDYLRLNDANVSGNYFKLDVDKFYSDSLKVEKFYPKDFEIVLNGKAFRLPEDNGTIESCSVDVTVYQVSESGGSPNKLCSVIYLGMYDNSYKEYKFNCIGISNEEIYFNEGDRIQLLLVEQCPSGAYMNIGLKGNSYIGVKAK